MALTVEQIEQLKRSAAMAPLSQTQVAEVLETASVLAAREREIARILASLGSRWPGVRHALNELSKLSH